MKITIEPTDFARMMALPLRERHDLLEFLGSTPISPAEAGALVRRIIARNDLISLGRRVASGV